MCTVGGTCDLQDYFRRFEDWLKREDPNSPEYDPNNPPFGKTHADLALSSAKIDISLALEVRMDLPDGDEYGQFLDKVENQLARLDGWFIHALADALREAQPLTLDERLSKWFAKPNSK